MVFKMGLGPGSFGSMSKMAIRAGQASKCVEYLMPICTSLELQLTSMCMWFLIIDSLVCCHTSLMKLFQVSITDANCNFMNS